MLDRKVFRSILDHFKKETNQVDPVLGGCCRRHGPYRVGPSSATTLKKGSLTQNNQSVIFATRHDGGTSNAVPH